jgi:hypothetical protein
MATYKITVSTLTALIVISSPLYAQTNGAPITGDVAISADTVQTQVSGVVNNHVNGTNWDTENQYWRNQYSTRSYYRPAMNYSAYEPAYRYGYDLYLRNNGRAYNELDQDELNRGWVQARGESLVDWQTAQIATQDAYNRLYTNRR